MASRFCVPVTSFRVTNPCFFIVGLVFFVFWSLVRFPSCFQLGVRALGGSLTLRRFPLSVEPLDAVMPMCSPGSAHSPLGRS